MLYAEYVQQLRYLPFNMDELEKLLNERPIKQWAYLIHDSDVDEKGKKKAKHIHIEMALKSNQKPETIASWFGDKPQRIQKATTQSKKYTYQNMCLYLIHDMPSADGKHQYDANNVIANFDFNQYVEDAKKGITEARERKKNSNIEEVLIKICNNEIPRLRIDEHLTEMEQITYAKKIEEAYRIRDRRESVKVDRMIEVMYFYGASETGKTTWAKEVSRMNNMSCCVSGASNDPLQSYIGQECLILDETRGENWDLSDLLKLLDNHTASMARSRYHNKLMSDCRLIIMTSVQSLDEFFANLNSGSSEQKKQLSRRITTMVKFTPDNMEFYVYDKEIGKHVLSRVAPNITKLLVDVSRESKTMETMLDYIEKVTGNQSAAEAGREALNQIRDFGKVTIAPNDEDLPFGDDDMEQQVI